jgi:hypothetical protein
MILQLKLVAGSRLLTGNEEPHQGPAGEEMAMPRHAIRHERAVTVLAAAFIAGRAAGVRGGDQVYQNNLCIDGRASALLPIRTL